MTTRSGADRGLHPGEATGEVVVLDAPLSFWGGFDPRSGLVIDGHHPQHGANLTETILVMPSGRGSSSSSSVLAEAIRLGTAPAAILLGEVDPIVVLGALVARELYGTRIPVAALMPETYRSLTSGETATVRVSEGTVEIADDFRLTPPSDQIVANGKEDDGLRRQ
ncbi:MAG: DUF126 domain-containing protein [Actinobacteria bacterium]|nr:DUF126 domain-containing protein [Actinomycetota bacterium]